MKQPAEKPAVSDLEEQLRNRHVGFRGDLLAAFSREIFPASDHAASTGKLDRQESLVVSSFEWIEGMDSSGFASRVFQPEDADTSADIRWVIQATGPDRPFLVDSLRELMRVRSCAILRLVHPLLSIERAADGTIIGLSPPRQEKGIVSFIHIETDGIETTENAESIAKEMDEVLGAVHRVVEDFEPMSGKVQETIDRLRERVVTEEDVERQEELAEVADLLDWLLSSNFVFLGSREYAVRDGDAGREISVVPGSGLGILKDVSDSLLREPQPFSALPADLRHRIENPCLLGVHKTKAESIVQRRTRMDYFIIRDLAPDGSLIGEQSFVGLLTARALGELPARIPVLRRKLGRILESSGLVPGSHDHKQYFSTFCSLPKAQLFLHDAAALRELISEIIRARDHQDVRVQYQYDPYDLSLSVMVLIPRERFNAHVRQSVQSLLEKKFQGTSIEYQLALTDEPLARLHFYFATVPGYRPQPPISELEAEIARITRTWEDRFGEEVRRRFEPGKAAYLLRRYLHAFPTSYTTREPPDVAVNDIGILEDAERLGRPAVRVEPGSTKGAQAVTVIKIARPWMVYHLSRLMPTLTHLGLEVFDESMHELSLRQADPIYLHTFRTLGPDGEVIRPGDTTRHLEETILAALEHRSVDDSLNSLVPLTGMSWRQVSVLRTYTAYLMQIDRSVSQRTLFLVLKRHHTVAYTLLELFECRFDPELSPERRIEQIDATRKRLVEFLDNVDGIQEDRILRTIENLILSTVRTNYFQRDQQDEPREALAIKLRCADIENLPLPRPVFEIFIVNHELEGIHLRSGKVARGGIRWSDRKDDFRTEILGLMKAQRTKNALIVPVGAKGGFILKREPSPEHLAAEVERLYRVSITSLLDLTDNVVDDAVIRPEDTVIHDDDDPYLVVAADKGTARFSDVANSIACSRSFWLGDAFASGGSTGYNHKEKGITAKGAWECVKRHFLSMGRDAQTEEFTAVGIGDMSGDVFGNGMLLSHTIRLVAAFDHRHIFVDPDPDPEASWSERKRLFELPRSSWDDYRRDVISPGGGVFPRAAKRIPLSERMKELLGVELDAMNGDELIRSVLTLPVDLIWNGGIGTYLKSSTETEADVGDPANDAVRLNAKAVRARVIGEGGNLGLTPRGRVEFARQGGWINTDFIDNSGGVDLSDREVNLKILLDLAVRRGKINVEERNRSLREVSAFVIDEVLRDNRLQSDAISLDRHRNMTHLPQIVWLIRELESRGLLNRRLEAIPSDPQLARLEQSRMGLTRPQLSAVLAHTKIDAYARIIASDLADHPDLEHCLLEYFPASFLVRFRQEILSHPLRREITITVAVGNCLNQMGTTFLHRLSRDEGRSLDECLHAYLIAGRLSRSGGFHEATDEIISARKAIPEEVAACRELFSEQLEGITRWCLRRGILDGRGRIDGQQLEASLKTRQRTPSDPDPEDPGPQIELQAHVAFAGHVLERLEALDVGITVGVDEDLARRTLDLAGARLLCDPIRAEARRIVRTTASDEQMLRSLEGDLLDLRRGLAIRILEAAGKDAKDEGPGEEDLVRIARHLVPRREPVRAEIERALMRSRSRQPIALSGLYVFVEGWRRFLGGSGLM